MPASVSDSLGRALRDLRISVTDRCNFRCGYCMPKELFGHQYAFLPRSEILSFEEITRLARIFVQLGAQKLRLTGGEPLLRKDLHQLVKMLGALDTELALTTNGSLLAQQAAGLRAAGLQRLTVSLDSLSEPIFRAMNDVDFPLARVLEGIDAAAAAGFAPIKINVVVKRGVNDHELVDLARRFAGPQFVVRFIEFMDVGNTNGWQLRDVVPGAEILARIQAELPLNPLPAQYPGEVASRYQHAAGGEIGIITSVSAPFCSQCTRARLAADGRLYTCLFASHGVDLRTPLRAGASDEDLLKIIGGIWAARTDRYSEIRSEHTRLAPKAEMSLLGG